MMVISNKTSQLSARDNQQCNVRIAAPDTNQKITAIIFMSAIFGVDDCMQGLMEDYAKEGYLVAAPDYFFRTEPGPESNKEKAYARMMSFDVEQGIKDLEDTINAVKQHEQCNGKVAVLGFCFGGLLAYLSAVRLEVDALAIYHGTQIHKYINEADNLTIPASLHYGDNDPVVPMDQVEIVQTKLASLSHCEVIVHQGGQHNFSMPGKLGYDIEIANRSREAVLKCFKGIE
jgi:carboxymethylenebutenolidase